LTISRILVATDFSLAADSVPSAALALARTIRASVHVLHVVENPLAAGVWFSEVSRKSLDSG
jgi:nucleotide-binding universal stress UspA family protein